MFYVVLIKKKVAVFCHPGLAKDGNYFVNCSVFSPKRALDMLDYCQETGNHKTGLDASTYILKHVDVNRVCVFGKETYDALPSHTDTPV